jgi:signal transduction histidine kinase
MIPSMPRALLEAVPFGFVLIDGNGTVLQVSSEVESLTGLRVSDLVGKGFFERFGLVAEIHGAEDALRGEGDDPDRLLIARARLKPVGGRKAFDADLLFRGFESDGQRYGLVVIPAATDEKETADAFDRRLSTIRHDLNNALMALIGHVELLALRRDLPDDALEKIRTVMEHAARLRGKISDMASSGAKE